MKQDILKTSSKMSQWNCCRTCLSVDSLNTIFAIPLEHHKFSDIIQSSAGIKVVFNDYLPQEMCEECISFINKCTKFRRKCELSQKTLNERFQQGQFCDIKVESLHMFKCEKSTATIDISDDNFETLGSNLRNIEQNINSNSYDYVDNFETGSEVEKTDADNKNPQIPIEFVSNVQNREDKSIESIFISRKSRRKTKPVSIKKSRKVIKKRTKKSYKNLENNQPVDHMNDTKEIENEKETTIRNREKQKIECEYCQKILTSKLSLRNHYKIHTGFDVVCEHCGKKFITRRLLLSHCRAKHGYEKTDKCSYCDYRASNAEQVKIHERLHTGEKPFVCKECSAGFHRKSSYLQHIAIHLPEKTVQCDECPALFKSVTLMRIHKNKHRQPQYSFKCYICHSSFARRRNVIRHLQRIHAVVDTRDIERVKIG